MSAWGWMLSKVGHRDNQKFNAMVRIMAQEHQVSEGRIKRDMYKNILTRGCGYTDYFRGDYFRATKELKDTSVNTKTFYKLLEYLNDEGYVNIMRDKIVFCDVFRSYLGREFLNLRVATPDEFCAFIEHKDSLFAKKAAGFRSLGVSKVDLSRVVTKQDALRLYEELRANEQYLVEETIQQAPEVCELCLSSVASFRVVTLVDGAGKAHLLGNTMRVNMDAEQELVGVTNTAYFHLNEDGTLDGLPFNDLGERFEEHPATHKRFDEVAVPCVREAFDLCLRAALEVPQVRYVGWNVAFSDHGPVLMEGNSYPSYQLMQFPRVTGRTTGHLADIAAVLGDEMSKIKL